MLAVSVPLDYEKYPITEALPDWIFWVVVVVILFAVFAIDLLLNSSKTTCPRCDGTGYIQKEKQGR